MTEGRLAADSVLAGRGRGTRPAFPRQSTGGPYMPGQYANPPGVVRARDSRLDLHPGGDDGAGPAVSWAVGPRLSARRWHRMSHVRYPYARLATPGPRVLTNVACIAAALPRLSEVSGRDDRGADDTGASASGWIEQRSSSLQPQRALWQAPEAHTRTAHPAPRKRTDDGALGWGEVDNGSHALSGSDPKLDPVDPRRVEPGILCMGAALNAMTSTRRRSRRSKVYRVAYSPIHGWGVFALGPIAKGTRIVEYKGQRISAEEAEARYGDDQSTHPHVLLFMVDDETLIDAAHGGNEARFVNHSCEPNCEAVMEGERVYIETVREIVSGEELTYDYQLQVDGRQTAELKRHYACNCGTKRCRGTMLAPRRKGRGPARAERGGAGK